MGSEKRLGIDPVDLESLDSSSIVWNTKTQTWDTADGGSVSCHMYGPSIEQLPFGKTMSWDSPTDVKAAYADCTYNSTLDYLYNKDIYVASLYCLGYTDAEIETVSIDDIIKRIRSVYNYRLSNKETASMTYIKRKNIALTRQVRRAFHKMQVLDGR
jgi:hypothetical protein